MRHRGSPRERFARWKKDLPLPELLATNRTRHPDPVRDTLALGIWPVSLLVVAVGPFGWLWWQRLLAFLGAVVLGVYPTLIFIGYWRISRRRKSG